MSVDDNHLKKIIVNRMKSENIRYHYCDYNHEITFYYKKNKYNLLVKNYPFRVPRKLKVNDKLINYNEISNNYKKYLRKYFGIQCLCCSSILCENNWLICYKFSDISKEHENFTNLITCIDNILILKEKFILPQEIFKMIIEYLKPKKN
tara:strand:- start:524 stop:970 length:447 start_codon:yes stop_codon:yes gene_type:complete